MKRLPGITCLLLSLLLCTIASNAGIRFTEIGMWGGTCNAVAVSGDIAYVGLGNCLATYDISDPASPSRLGYVSLPDVINKMVVSGHYAYIPYDWLCQVMIVDVSDPGKPFIAGCYDGSQDMYYGIMYDVAVSGSNLWIASSSGMFKVDVSNPASPVQVDCYADYNMDYKSVAAYGDYMLYSDAYLYVVDSPVYYPSWLPGVSAKSLTVSGHYVYAACGYEGVKIIDLTDPTYPVLAATIEIPGLISCVTVSGNRAYVVESTGGLEVFDITDPTHPTIVGSYPALSSACNVAVSGDCAVVADGPRGFCIVDISDPSAPSIIYSTDIGGIDNIAVKSNTALATCGTSSQMGFYTIDLANPTAPSLLNWTSAPAFGDMITHNDLAFMFDPDNYKQGIMRVFDISSLTSPALLSYLTVDPYTRCIAFSGRYAYVGGYKKITVIDIADPSAPVAIGSAVSSGACVNQLVISGEYLYAGSYDGGLEVFSTADPTNPVLITSYKQYRPGYMLPAGNILYTGGSLLRMFDISDPANPVLVATFPMYSYHLLLSGSTLYVSNANGVAALDVANPAAPVLVGQWHDQSGSSFVAVSGDIAYAQSGTTVRVVKMEQSDISVVYGRVLDALGHPPYSAQVSAGGVSTTIDSEGYYILGNLPPGEYTVTASGTLWAAQSKNVTLAPNQSQVVDFTFQMGTISGTVVDSLGLPVSGAIVGYISSHAPSIPSDQMSYYEPILTGPDGKYSIPDLYPDEYIVSVHKTGCDSGYEYVDVIGGQDNKCDLVLHLRAVVSGRVTDSRGAPISGLAISYENKNGYPPISVTATTDANGYYRFSDIREGSCQIRVLQGTQAIAVKGFSVTGGLTKTCDFILPDQLPLTLVGSCNLGGQPSSICLVGSTAYVTCGSAGLAAVDVSDPRKPSLLSTFGISGNASDVKVCGRYAYVAAGEAGLQIVDVSNPVCPVLSGTCAVTGSAVGIDLQGDYAYVADSAGWLVIISTQDPTNPIVVSQIATPAIRVAASGDYAYVLSMADIWGTKSIVNISNPTQPRLYHSYYSSSPLNIALSGRWAFVTDSFEGLVTFDLSNPLNPVRLASLSAPGSKSICIADRRVYLAHSNGGLSVFDISDPASPTLIGTTPSSAVDVAASGGYVYTVDSTGCLCIHDLFHPSITSITPNTGYNDSVVTITGVSGLGFDPGCSVKLIRPGQPDIVATNISALSNTISCTFDLRGAMPGNWTVCVANPDGKLAEGSYGGFLVRVAECAPRLGVRCCDAQTRAVVDSARDHRVVVWGKVQSASSANIQITDGSGGMVAIRGAGFSRLTPGNYISACGTLEPTTNPPTLFCQPTNIVKY